MSHQAECSVLWRSHCKKCFGEDFISWYVDNKPSHVLLIHEKHISSNVHLESLCSSRDAITDGSTLQYTTEKVQTLTPQFRRIA